LKIKKTFFNSRNERYYWNHTDINNWLFTIIHKEGGNHLEKNYILRDIKQNKSTLDYIYKKINERFDVVEIETGRLSKVEYDMLKNINTPSIINCVKTEQVS
jgi:hypothetical protein